MHILQKLIDLKNDADKFGFKWDNVYMIVNQVKSEVEEVEEVLKNNEGKARLQEEMGDLLDAAINLCLECGLDLDETLVKSFNKISTRINSVKEIAKERGFSDLNNQSHEVLMEIWNEAKKLNA